MKTDVHIQSPACGLGNKHIFKGEVSLLMTSHHAVLGLVNISSWPLLHWTSSLPLTHRSLLQLRSSVLTSSLASPKHTLCSYHCMCRWYPPSPPPSLSGDWDDFTQHFKWMLQGEDEALSWGKISLRFVLTALKDFKDFQGMNAWHWATTTLNYKCSLSKRQSEE